MSRPEYPLPTLSCGETSCIMAERSKRVPVDSYWLCPACTKGAPSAVSLQRASLPQGFSLGKGKWTAAERKKWTVRQNATTLQAFATIREAGAAVASK